MTDPLDFTKPLEGAPGLLETTDVRRFVGSLSEILAPRFKEQRESWDREGPAATALFEATGAILDTIGGNCPVQAEGNVDGQRFYFRARGASWEFHVAPTDAEIFEADIFYMERDYGSTFEAGWMHRHEALAFIVEAIALFRTFARAQAIAPTLTEVQRGFVGADLEQGLPAGVAAAFIMQGLIEKEGEDSVRWSPVGRVMAAMIKGECQ